MKIQNFLFWVILLTSSGNFLHANNYSSPLDDARKEAISKALPNLDPKLIEVRNGQGKIDSNPKVKLSYFVYTAEPNNPRSPTLLVPLATSRFDRYNYSTDEWWDANKQAIEKSLRDGTPKPRQDPAEVARYLQQNGLSVNPDVYTVYPASPGRTASISKQQLREFLLNYHLRRYQGSPYVTMYRGGEKPGELNSWLRREYPRGARYWTIDATYAWRYARKNPKFLEELIEGRAPLFRFDIPKEVFIKWVRNGMIVLGSELTRTAHRSYTQYGRFVDHLTPGDFYLGDGTLGLEMEMRPRRSARQEMAQYFTEAISIEDMASKWRDQLKRGYERLEKAYPEAADSLQKEYQRRLQMVHAEEALMQSVRMGATADYMTEQLKKMPQGSAEFSNVDYTSLTSVVKGKISGKGTCNGLNTGYGFN